MSPRDAGPLVTKRTLAVLALVSVVHVAVLIEVAWEIAENSPFVINRFRAATASLDYTGDSILNSVGDVTFCLLGFFLASKLSWKWSVAIVVLSELTLLLLIRDNLFLSVLMLLYPIRAIKNWQMGGQAVAL